MRTRTKLYWGTMFALSAYINWPDTPQAREVEVTDQEKRQVLANIICMAGARKYFGEEATATVNCDGENCTCEIEVDDEKPKAVGQSV